MRIAAKATKGKGKLWKRGQSSASNPETNKFRSKAKKTIGRITPSGSFGGDATDQSLTIEKLANHNALQLESLSLGLSDDNDDAQSVVSFASAWSKCTNPSFDRFLNGWQASSPLHKEMLAVLGSVTEIIKSKGGKESETEYFAVLVTTMETVETEEGLTAVVHLLRMILKRVPVSVLRLKFSEVSKILVHHLEKHTVGENGMLLRSLIASLSTFLRNQDEATWSLSNTHQVFTAILTFCEHRKPRVRKTAQRAVSGILKGTNSPSSNCHPAAPLVAKYCIHQMEETGLKDDFGKLLHSISMLRDVLPILPLSSIKACCETMLRFMTLGNVLISTSCFQTFNAMFKSKPKNMTQELNLQILLALQDFQPSVSDSQPLAAWLTVIHESANCLHSLDPKQYYKQILSVTEIYVTCWLSDSQQVQTVVAANMKAVVANCMRPEDHKVSNEALTKTIAIAQSCLSFQYNNSWDSVFSVLATTFQLVGKAKLEMTLKSLELLSNLRESDTFEQRVELDKAVVDAIKSVGPEVVLQAIPLNMDVETAEFTRSWLLILLRDNITRARLGFFAKCFVPMIVKAQKAIGDLLLSGREIESKAMHVYYCQLWSLLPSFCTYPTDLVQSFKLIAKNLGQLLPVDLKARPSILSALRMLLKTCESEAEKAELSKYAKNYMPILLNLYTTPSSEVNRDSQLTVLATISEYLPVADAQLRSTLYQKLKERLSDSSIEPFTQVALLDLMRVFTPHLESAQLEEVFQSLVIELISEGKSIKEQKKGYRILEELCRAETVNTRNTVEAHLAEILTSLVNGLKRSPVPAKSAPLKALSALIERYFSEAPQDARQLIFNILPAVVDCLLIKTVRTRKASFELLNVIAEALCKIESGFADMYSFVLIALKQESLETRSATIEALEHLLPVLKKSLPKESLHGLFSEILDLVRSDNRSIFRAVINFLKAIFKELTKDDLLPFVEKIITSMDSLGAGNRKHFRTPIKEIFVRLCRKYGNEMITKMVPKSFSIVLRTVRKEEARKARNRNKEDDEDSVPQPRQTALSEKDAIDVVLRDSSDEEMDDDEQVEKKRQNSTWIEEKGEEEVLDLLSNKASRKILSTNPFKSRLAKMKKSSAMPFETAADGRLIIKDEDREENENDDDVIADGEPRNTAISTKRPHQDESDEDQEDEAEEPRARYKHGGKGIHRAFQRGQKEAASNAGVKTGREYRSAKARGDMKKKDLPDPYAYVPLQQQALNKRKRAKFAGQFKSIMNAAKKGANIGSKQQQKRRKTK
ncbi:RRP12-like protein [Halotydeus destructor]|nr:RRP12-like protein [Halotydeus destructor]